MLIFEKKLTIRNEPWILFCETKISKKGNKFLVVILTTKGKSYTYSVDSGLKRRLYFNHKASIPCENIRSAKIAVLQELLK